MKYEAACRKTQQYFRTMCFQPMGWAPTTTPHGPWGLGPNHAKTHATKRCPTWHRQRRGLRHALQQTRGKFCLIQWGMLGGGLWVAIARLADPPLAHSAALGHTAMNACMVQAKRAAKQHQMQCKLWVGFSGAHRHRPARVRPGGLPFLKGPSNRAANKLEAR